MLPSVLSEGCLKPFKFYDGSQIREAIFVQRTIYKHIASYLDVCRQQAYNLGISLTNQGYPALLTVSECGYRVWVDVRYEEEEESMVAATLSS